MSSYDTSYNGLVTDPVKEFHHYSTFSTRLISEQTENIFSLFHASTLSISSPDRVKFIHTFYHAFKTAAWFILKC